ncbi:hypothetical protein MAMT_00281 [Methylacidimicrobium tartarophylax]|uniref:Uncharacterized protein n=2 Tax=Methylacidimicrobium tartarophylax TaxID=1041768 RepID=A0A5E6M740_9BACT|nr:hypothetical protein MAMT_00281 [Methylacidimicrobium tartarophylax]
MSSNRMERGFANSESMKPGAFRSGIAALPLLLAALALPYRAEAQSDPEYPLPSQSASEGRAPDRAPSETPLHPVQMGPANSSSSGQAPALDGTPRAGQETPFDPTGGLRTFLESLPDKPRKFIEHHLNRKATHALVGRTDSLGGTYVVIHEGLPPPQTPLVHVFLLADGKVRLLFTSTTPFRVPASLRIPREDKMSLLLSYIFFQQSNRVPPVLSQEARPTAP